MKDHHTESTLKQMKKSDLVDMVMLLEENAVNYRMMTESICEANAKLVNLLNKHKIEWIECVDGYYRIKEITK